MRLAIVLALTLSLSGCSGCWHGRPFSGEPGGYATDAGGRPIEALEAGSSLQIGAHKMKPNTTYEFRVAVGKEPARSLEEVVSFARSTTDRDGNIPPVVLWYQSGVVGCSEIPKMENRPYVFRDFDEAERSLEGKSLTISLHEVER